MWLRGVPTVLVALPALLFITMGLRWLVDPAGVAPTLGMTLESGIGLSTQVGDLSAFFLVAGLSMMIALVTRTRTWFYPPMMSGNADPAGLQPVPAVGPQHGA